LVLNLDYTPFDVWDWQHAMKKYIPGNIVLDEDTKVEAVYDTQGMVKHDFIVRDGLGNRHELPAVVKLLRYVDANQGRAQYTKLNVYARDMGICQYCGTYTRYGSHTVDHVIPRAHWNPRRFHFKLSSFENVVTACDPCNKRKRNRTPQQADMKLICKPRGISKTQAYSNKMAMITNKPVQWGPYLKVSNVSKT
jgi:5-methylcytosine-specific restriction endonuclease McrA